MIAKVRAVSLAAVAMLAIAMPCFAQDSEFEQGEAVDIEIGHVPGHGGVGGQIGTSNFRPDRMLGEQWFGDYSDGATMRFSFSGHFRYAFTSWFRVQVGPGLTWSGYNELTPAPFPDPNFASDPLDPRTVNKGEYLTLMVPIPLMAQYVFTSGRWLYYGGAGPGLYRVWVENDRKVLKDPGPNRLHRGVYFGGSVMFGVERFFEALPSTSVELSLSGHVAVTERDEQFPAGFNSNVSALEIRIGANYYFTPGPREAEDSLGPDIPPP